MTFMSLVLPLLVVATAAIAACEHPEDVCTNGDAGHGVALLQHGKVRDLDRASRRDEERSTSTASTKVPIQRVSATEDVEPALLGDVSSDDMTMSSSLGIEGELSQMVPEEGTSMPTVAAADVASGGSARSDSTTGSHPFSTAPDRWMPGDKPRKPFEIATHNWMPGDKAPPEHSASVASSKGAISGDISADAPEAKASTVVRRVPAQPMVDPAKQLIKKIRDWLTHNKVPISNHLDRAAPGAFPRAGDRHMPMPGDTVTESDKNSARPILESGDSMPTESSIPQDTEAGNDPLISDPGSRGDVEKSDSAIAAAATGFALEDLRRQSQTVRRSTFAHLGANMRAEAAIERAATQLLAERRALEQEKKQWEREHAGVISAAEVEADLATTRELADELEERRRQFDEREQALQRGEKDLVKTRVELDERRRRLDAQEEALRHRKRSRPVSLLEISTSNPQARTALRAVEPMREWGVGV